MGYAKKTCERCGLNRPIYEMQKVEKRVKGTRSGASWSVNTKRPGSGIRVSGGRQYYRNAKLYYCAHRKACDDPDYFVRLAREKAEKEAELAREKAEKEAELVREKAEKEERKSRKKRIDKEIKRQKENENFKYDLDELELLLKDFTKEIRDCENDFDKRKSSFKITLWFIILSSLFFILGGGFILLLILTVLIYSLFLLRTHSSMFSALRVPYLKKRIPVLKECAQNLGGISKKRSKEKTPESSAEDARVLADLDELEKEEKEKTPKSVIDKLLESDDFFNIATTVLAKSIAEADGKITKEEWDAYRKSFEIDKEDFKLVEKIWAKDFSPSAFAKELAKRHKKKKILLEIILNNLFFVAEADGEIASEEIEMLRNYATIFGLSPEKFARIMDGKKESVKNTDKKKTILDDDPYIFLDDLEIDDDFEFGEE